MNTYNTGKVKIGLLYTPPQRPHHDADALRLQRALLGERPRIGKMIDRIELGQFVVCAGHLCEYTDRWDFWWGFLRVIKPLKETK